jgi:prepilin peptidase CpaA
MTSDAMAVAIVVGGSGTGAVIDLCVRRVPNTLTMSLAAVGVALAAAGLGRGGVGTALAGCLVGLVLMLPGYLLGGTGAGDVKLLAATLLGPVGVLWAFLYTAVAGGIIALLVAAARGRLRHSLENTGWFIVSRGANVSEVKHPQAHNRFAYAPAIAIGATLAALGG